jgi:hypothetical protein
MLLANPATNGILRKFRLTDEQKYYHTLKAIENICHRLFILVLIFAVGLITPILVDKKTN